MDGDGYVDVMPNHEGDGDNDRNNAGEAHVVSGRLIADILGGAVTAIGSTESILQRAALWQNYPNPFNGLRYEIARYSQVELAIYISASACPSGARRSASGTDADAQSPAFVYRLSNDGNRPKRYFAHDPALVAVHQGRRYFLTLAKQLKQQAGDLMKKVLLTGTTGTVAHVMRQELGDEYDISGISIARMDEILERDKPIVWKEQLDAYNERVIEQVTEAARGQDAIVHLGWNTRDENWQKGLIRSTSPLPIASIAWP